RLEWLQKIRIFPGVRFHLFPAEKLVVARRDSANIEAAVLIGDLLLEEVELVAMRFSGNEDHPNSGCGQTVGILGSSLNPRAAGTDRHLESGLRSASHVLLIARNLHS